MKRIYHESARSQYAEFLGAPQGAAENQRLSPLSERDRRSAGETTPVNRHSWICPVCSERLKLRLYPSRRGFELLCKGTDSIPHQVQIFASKLRKEHVSFLLSPEFQVSWTGRTQEACS
jgi:hypothetical protein